jgi:hypothetical protein
MQNFKLQETDRPKILLIKLFQNLKNELFRMIGNKFLNDL